MVVVSLAGQEKPSGLVRERRVLVVAEVVIDASTKSVSGEQADDKAKSPSCPRSGYLEPLLELVGMLNDECR